MKFKDYIQIAKVGDVILTEKGERIIYCVTYKNWPDKNIISGIIEYGYFDKNKFNSSGMKLNNEEEITLVKRAKEHKEKYILEEKNEFEDINVKIGDLVKFCGHSVSCNHEEEMYAKGIYKHPLEVGKIYEITEVTKTDYGNFVSVRGNGIFVRGTYMSQFKKYNKNIMNTIKSLFRSEKEKLFIEAGLKTENDEITEKGKEALNYILWKVNEEELVKIATKIVTNEKNDSR